MSRIERITFQSQTQNRAGAKFFTDVLTTGARVEDITDDDRIAAELDLSSEDVSVVVSWTPGVAAASRNRVFMLEGVRYEVRRRDRLDNRDLRIVGRRLA